MSRTPRTEPPIAPQPEQVYRPAPRQKRIERQGDSTEPIVRMYPRVMGGVCEFCGILDPHQPSHYQYKLCPHYRGMELRCSYCPGNKDPDQIVHNSKLHIYDHPTKPDEMIVVCNAYECTRKHQERFRV